MTAGAALAAAAAALALAGPAAGAQIEVWPGQSLERARDAARRSAGADTIVLHGGTYRLARTLVLDARDSGVAWQAAPGETPVVSGGVPVTGWTPAADGRWQARLPGLHARQLWVNGVRAVRAGGSPPPLVRTPTGFATADGSPLPWRNPQDVELVFDAIWREYRGHPAAVRGGEIEMQQPFFANALLDHWATIGLPTWIENAPELLDRPGEWYLDRPSGVLTYLPRDGEDMRAASAVVPRLETLVSLRGTFARPIRDVSLTGITFAETGWLGAESPDGFAPMQADMRVVGRQSTYDGMDERLKKLPAALELRAAQNVRIERDRFVRLGGSGIDVSLGSRDDAIEGCELTDISGNGIQLGDVGDHHPTDAREPTARIRVANDWIHAVAVEYRSGVGIWGGYLADTTIAHNELADLPYTGISLGWGWGDRDQPPTPAARNLVESNYIHDVMQSLGDGAGIYLLGAQPGTVVRANVVLHVTGFGGAIYLDDGSRDETVEGNLAFDTHGWPSMLKGQSLTVRDNLWDSYSDWSFYKFDGTVSGERVIRDLAEAPSALLAAAGLEPEYRALLRP